MKHAILVGYGSIGAKRARILRGLGWDLMIWEPDKQLKRRAVLDGFTDVLQVKFPDMLSAIGLTRESTVAFICSPPKYHADHAIACLEAGCHVFIEKPIAHTMEDARRISEAANGRHVMVGCNYRYANLPGFAQSIRGLDILLKYDLPTARPNWRRSYVNDPSQGGLILDSGVHAIDLAQQLAGPIARIIGVEKPKDSRLGIEDAVQIVLQHTNKIMTRIHLDWTKKKAVRRVICEVNDQYWHVDLWDGTDAMFEREMKAFLEAIENDKAPPNGPEEATETLKWCLNARDML